MVGNPSTKRSMHFQTSRIGHNFINHDAIFKAKKVFVVVEVDCFGKIVENFSASLGKEITSSYSIYLKSPFLIFI